jgi:hypothetical protein
MKPVYATVLAAGVALASDYVGNHESSFYKCGWDASKCQPGHKCDKDDALIRSGYMCDQWPWWVGGKQSHFDNDLSHATCDEADGDNLCWHWTVAEDGEDEETSCECVTAVEGLCEEWVCVESEDAVHLNTTNIMPCGEVDGMNTTFFYCLNHAEKIETQTCYCTESYANASSVCQSWTCFEYDADKDSEITNKDINEKSSFECTKPGVSRCLEWQGESRENHEWAVFACECEGTNETEIDACAAWKCREKGMSYKSNLDSVLSFYISWGLCAGLWLFFYLWISLNPEGCCLPKMWNKMKHCCGCGRLITLVIGWVVYLGLAADCMYTAGYPSFLVYVLVTAPISAVVWCCTRGGDEERSPSWRKLSDV